MSADNKATDNAQHPTNQLDSNDAGDYLVFGNAVSVNEHLIVVRVHREVCPPREGIGLLDWLHKHAIAAVVKRDDGALPHPAPWPDRKHCPWVRRIWQESSRIVVIDPAPERDQLEIISMESQPMMRVRLSGPQRQRLELLSQQHGLEPLELLSRLVEWFGRADESERHEIESHIARSAHHRRTEYN